MQKKLYSEGIFIAKILIDLSKSYGCLPDHLLIATLEAHGVALLLDFLIFRKQRTKLGHIYSWLFNNQIFAISQMIIPYTNAEKSKQKLRKPDFLHKKLFKLV